MKFFHYSLNPFRPTRIVLLASAVLFFVGGYWLQPSIGQTRPMPEGPGQVETRKFCTQCHDLDKSLSLKQDRAGWRITVDKMVAFGMKAKEEDVTTVIDYLARNYPADDVPRLKVNEAEAIDFESILAIKRSQASAIIQYREKNGKFKTIEDLKKVPGIDPAKIEAKKDRLIF